jgi:hypothetical protein
VGMRRRCGDGFLLRGRQVTRLERRVSRALDSIERASVQATLSSSG